MKRQPFQTSLLALILEEKNVRDHAKKIVHFLFLCFTIPLQCQSCLLDSPSSHGDDHHLVSVPKVTAHGHLPKAGDGLDRPPCRFPLCDKHVRQYDAPPGSSITQFVRVGGVRFHMHQLSTVSDFGLRAEGRLTIPRRRPMQAICNVAVRLAASSHSPPTFSIVRRSTLRRRQEQLVACIDLYGKKPFGLWRGAATTGS